MSRMFCTLEEAAKTLNTSEDQIDTLLQRGLLPEFREGPHRLLREADIDALALAQRPRTRTPRPARSPTPTQQAARPPVSTKRPTSRRRKKPKTSRPAKSKRPPVGVVVSPPLRAPQPPVRSTAFRRSEDRVNAALPTPSSVVRHPSSIRQWFWMGLVQDRPTAIALLAGLILLVLSAVAVGICFLAESR